MLFSLELLHYQIYFIEFMNNTKQHKPMVKMYTWLQINKK